MGKKTLKTSFDSVSDLHIYPSSGHNGKHRLIIQTEKYMTKLHTWKDYLTEKMLTKWGKKIIGKKCR